MNNLINRITAALTMGAAVSFAPGLARADDGAALRTESNRLERNAALTGQTQTSTRIIHDFTDFAGSRANASSLVIGLRRGTPITLTAPSGNGGEASNSFMPPSRALRNSTVYISLALAKQQLASLGISQPTPEQIKAVLIGGTVTGGAAALRAVALPGVLTLRSQGMSWIAIARSQGVKLGTVVNGMQGANHDLVVLHLHYVSTNASQMPAAGATVN